MQAGTLKDRISLQSATRTLNAKGEPVATWAEYAKRWANVRSISGRQIQQAQQVQAEADVAVRMRYTDLVKPGHRIVLRGRTLQINAVLDEDGRRWELLLLCKELVSP